MLSNAALRLLAVLFVDVVLFPVLFYFIVSCLCISWYWLKVICRKLSLNPIFVHLGLLVFFYVLYAFSLWVRFGPSDLEFTFGNFLWWLWHVLYSCHYTTGLGKIRISFFVGFCGGFSGLAALWPHLDRKQILRDRAYGEFIYPFLGLWGIWFCISFMVLMIAFFQSPGWGWDEEE